MLNPIGKITAARQNMITETRDKVFKVHLNLISLVLHAFNREHSTM